MLAHAVMLTGTALYVASWTRPSLLTAACIVFCIGAFTKHNLIAFPLAVTIDLLLRSRRRFGWWMAIGGLSTLVLGALTLWIDGPFVLQHLLMPRRYSAAQGRFISTAFLRIFLPGIGLALGWCWKRSRRSEVRFLAFALFLSLCVGLVFSGGAGVFVNVFYDTIIVIAIISGLIMADLRSGLPSGSPAWCAAVLILPIVCSAMPILSGLYAPSPSGKSVLRDNQLYAEDVAYLKGQTGTAICFDLQLCFDAGKPLSFEPYATRELIAAGRLDERTLVAEIENESYAAVQSEPGFNYFPPLMRKAFQAHYRLDRRSDPYVFYVPVNRRRP